MFLPTVSHALSHLALADVRSKSLEAKLDAIAQQDSHMRTEHDSRHTKVAAQGVIKVHLWQLMQNGLRSSHAGKKHKAARSTEKTRYSVESGLKEVAEEAEALRFQGHAKYQGIAEGKSPLSTSSHRSTAIWLTSEMNRSFCVVP